VAVLLTIREYVRATAVKVVERKKRYGDTSKLYSTTMKNANILLPVDRVKNWFAALLLRVATVSSCFYY